MRHASDDEPHFAFKNMYDLLLRMMMLGHAAPRRERRDLIHVLSVRDRSPSDPGANFNRRVFVFHPESFAGQRAM